MTTAMAGPASALSPGMRRVLDAPRGQRFGRPVLNAGPSLPARPSAASAPPLASLGRTPRERELLAQMPDTPRLRRRLTQGDLPLWMAAPEQPDPRPREEPAPGPGQGDEHEPEPVRVPRPRRERPPLPRRADRPYSPRRPVSHRRPRRRVGWRLAGYTLATVAGALAHHLTGLLG